jgi:hypothetical protein
MERKRSSDLREVEVRGLFGADQRLHLRLAGDEESLSQDEEWFEVLLDGEWRRLRIHDYDQVYSVPGLYESVVYRLLKCVSPVTVVSLLREAVLRDGQRTESLRVLDFGAGNGMAGYELQNLGVETVVGIDIIEQAREATRRDRPWCYDDYVVADLTSLTPSIEELLRGERFNCLIVVAALGFGDIPSEAFLNALDLVESPGWLAFNIKQNFLESGESSGFAGLLQDLAREGVIETQNFLRYQHRVSMSGEPLYYGAMTAKKLKPIPSHFLSK